MIEHDPDATRRCYAQIPWGSDCDCSPCRNLDTLGSDAFPADVRQVLDELGIDLHKPAEVYHCGRLKNGLHFYGGWYHCAGRIVSGPDVCHRGAAPSTSQPLEAPSAEGFRIDCSSLRELVPDVFGDLELVQVDFTAELPWVLDEAEPM